MLKIQVLSVLGLFFFGLVVAHPHPYPKWAIPKTKDGELPKPLSYHIHCQFVNGDSQVVAEALQFRDKFIEHFNLTHTTHCMDTFAETRLCMFDLELKPDLDSPFVSGNWAVFVPIEWFSTSKSIYRNIYFQSINEDLVFVRITFKI
jgi:hypothetical protein